MKRKTAKAIIGSPRPETQMRISQETLSFDADANSPLGVPVVVWNCYREARCMIMTKSGETPIARLSNATPSILSEFLRSGITSVEQLVAATAAVGGVDEMSGYLNIPPDVFRGVVLQAEGMLSPEERVRLTNPIDVTDLGMGANRPTGTG